MLLGAMTGRQGVVLYQLTKSPSSAGIIHHEAISVPTYSITRRTTRSLARSVIISDARNTVFEVRYDTPPKSEHNTN